MQRWQGRVALVTGASSGIGAAIAKRLVKEGMIVVGFARRGDRIEAVSKELSGHKGKLHAFKGDLQKEEDIKAVFAWIEDHLKSPVHVMINNAAYVPIDTALGGNTDGWRQALEVNVLGLAVCTREAVKSMQAHHFDEGHIININSVAGHSVTSYVAAMYSATKFAVTALTEATRKQLAARKSKTRVTSISPGAVRTEVFDNVPDTGFSIEDIPKLEPSDVVDATIFVLSLRQQVHYKERPPMNVRGSNASYGDTPAERQVIAVNLYEVHDARKWRK